MSRYRQLVHFQAAGAIVVGILLFGSARSQTTTEVEASIATLNREIEQIERELAQTRAQSDSVIAELAQIERQLGDQAAELTALETRLLTLQSSLAALERRQQQGIKTLNQQRREVVDLIRLAWAFDRRGALAFWFGTDHQRLGRQMAYLRYLGDRRTESLGRIQHELNTLRDLAEQQLAEEAALAETVARQQTALVAQRGLMDERRAVLGRLIQRSSDRAAQHEELTEERSALQELLERLALIDIPVAQEFDHFEQLRQQLVWPIKDQPWRHAPGVDKSGGMHRFGGFIAAEEGSNVVAVAPGRVAFADWLRGFGLIVIIEHGDEYMSLYAYNQVLFKEVGEWVMGGEPVAAAGLSGGRSEPGLYFELRQDGRPVDPRSWFASVP